MHVNWDYPLEAFGADAAVEHEAKLVVPPRENAVPWEEVHPRNQALADIDTQGKEHWEKSKTSGKAGGLKM